MLHHRDDCNWPPPCWADPRSRSSEWVNCFCINSHYLAALLAKSDDRLVAIDPGPFAISEAGFSGISNIDRSEASFRLFGIDPKPVVRRARISSGQLGTALSSAATSSFDLDGLLRRLRRAGGCGLPGRNVLAQLLCVRTVRGESNSEPKHGDDEANDRQYHCKMHHERRESIEDVRHSTIEGQKRGQSIRKNAWTRRVTAISTGEWFDDTPAQASASSSAVVRLRSSEWNLLVELHRCVRAFLRQDEVRRP